MTFKDRFIALFRKNAQKPPETPKPIQNPFKSPVSKVVTARRDDPNRNGIRKELPVSGIRESGKSMLSKMKVMTPLGEAIIQEDIYNRGTGVQEMVIKVGANAELIKEQLKSIVFIPVIGRNGKVIRVYPHDKGSIRVERNELILNINSATDYDKLTDTGRTIADETAELLRALSVASK
ncbi:MAG: hypothetical protein V1492_04835 [Candidatus Micrarchaeota archaeon]